MRSRLTNLLRRLRDACGVRTNAALRREIDKLAGRLAVVARDRDRADDAAGQWLADLGRERAEAARLRDRLAATESELARLQREAGVLERTNHDLAGRADTLAHERDALAAERSQLREMVDSLMERVKQQSELLGRAALAGGPDAARVAELEHAIAPFAAVTSETGWDECKMLPADAIYPVRLGDLRRAARALAGTRPPLRATLTPTDPPTDPPPEPLRTMPVEKWSDRLT